MQKPTVYVRKPFTQSLSEIVVKQIITLFYKTDRDIFFGIAFAYTKMHGIFLTCSFDEKNVAVVGMDGEKIERSSDKVSEKHTRVFTPLLPTRISLILFSCFIQLRDTDHFVKIRYGLILSCAIRKSI